MSNAIDWATAVANLTTAIGTATGADLAVGTALRDGPPGTTGQGLAAAGAAYDARYAAVGVDDAKGVWLAAAQAVWTQADHAARYAESLSGTPGPSLSFNAYDNSALVARLAKALAGLPSGSEVAADLAAQSAALAAVWSPPTHGKITTYSSQPTPAHYIATAPSVRTIELALVPQIAAATAWLALFNS
jgi:hypothetical protein